MKKGFINFVVAIAAVALGVSLSLKPWRVYQQQKLLTQQQVADLRKVEHEHTLDLQREAKLGSNLGQEQLARAQGWHKKGEVPAGD